MVVSAASTKGAERRGVSCCCWGIPSFLNQELAAFCTCLLAVSIFSSEERDRPFLEAQEDREGSSTGCIRGKVLMRGRRSQLGCSSINQVYKAPDPQSAWLLESSATTGLNVHNCAAGSSYSSLDPKTALCNLHCVSATARFSPWTIYSIMDNSKSSPDHSKPSAFCQDPDYNIHSRCCKVLFSIYLFFVCACSLGFGEGNLQLLNVFLP